MTEWLGLPALAAANGEQIDNLIGWMHVFMFVLFIGWGGFFAYCLVRFRRSRNPVADYAGARSHASSYLEGAVAIVEAILLLGFSIPIWAARVDHAPPESDALVVQVTGEQFAWNIHYAGPDGKFGRTDLKLIDLQSNPLGLDRSDPDAKDDVTTVNQLYLPVNRPIIVQLRSKDVIHSFNVPEFRVKQDVVPGLTIPVWFIPTVTTADMRARMGKPDFQYKSPARSSAAWATPTCVDSSPSRPPTNSRRGWTSRSRNRSRPDRIRSCRRRGRFDPGLPWHRDRPAARSAARSRAHAEHLTRRPAPATRPQCELSSRNGRRQRAKRRSGRYQHDCRVRGRGLGRFAWGTLRARSQAISARRSSAHASRRTTTPRVSSTRSAVVAVTGTERGRFFVPPKPSDVPPVHP